MKKYSDILRRVFDNLQESDISDGSRIASIKRDMEDTLIKMFTDSEAPITTKAYNLSKSYDNPGFTTVIPADSTYISSLSPNSMSKFNITAGVVEPSASTTDMNVLITSSSGKTEFFNQDYTLVDQIVLDIEEDAIKYTDSVGLIIKITTSNTAGRTVNCAMSFTEDVNTLVLDDTAFIPFEFDFKVSTAEKAVSYRSHELTEEEYNKWNPGGSIAEGEAADGYEVELDIGTTEENALYDDSIGFFTRLVGDNLELVYKPSIEGVVLARMSFYPEITLDEGDPAPIHRAFIDGIVLGTTLRQLRKRLMKGGIGELEMVQIKSAIAEYTPDFLQAIDKFGGYNNRKTEVRSIKMFSVCSDPSMDIW